MTTKAPTIRRCPTSRWIDIELDRSPARNGYAITPQGVAWLPVRGILVKREGEIDADLTEFESYARLGTVLRSCLGDTRVRAILFDVDSCGGEVGGLFDLAADIRTATSVKPIWAIANDDALSAGYALASAASQVCLTKVGAVGSIGAVAAHTDQSAVRCRPGACIHIRLCGRPQGGRQRPSNR